MQVTKSLALIKSPNVTTAIISRKIVQKINENNSNATSTSDNSK